MLTGPVEASRRAVAKAGLELSDIDLWELNEAFASVVLHFMDETGIPHDKMNVNGGAIAMGHPLGATGAMVLGTLIDELERACGASHQEMALALLELDIAGRIDVLPGGMVVGTEEPS